MSTGVAASEVANECRQAKRKGCSKKNYPQCPDSMGMNAKRNERLVQGVYTIPVHQKHAGDLQMEEELVFGVLMGKCGILGQKWIEWRQWPILEK